MSFDVPEDLHYTETHEWVDPNSGRIGITDFAQDELGDIVFVELPDTGERVEAQSDFGVVESIKAVSDIYAPVSGEVVAVNDSLEDEPELVNEDPYGEGHLIEVDITEEGAFEDLLSAESYRETIE